MRSPLSIAVAQPSCVARHVTANANAHAETVREARARILVFPELSLTGYELEAEAVSPAGDELAPIVDACGTTGSIALVGAPVADEDGREHIATLRVSGDGVQLAYRKMFLGESEAQRFTPGSGPVAIDVDGWSLGLGICKDTGVAEHIDATAALGIDAYVAGMVHQLEGLAEQQARALRIATKVRAHVAFASFAGPTGGGFDTTAGHSGVWSPSGEVLAQAGTAPGEIARATIG